MKLSKNFTLEELVFSNTAYKFNINNKPSDAVVHYLTLLAKNILQPLRDAYGKPIKVTSGYRCKALNKIVNGSINSQHVLGQAADIRSLEDTKTENKKLFDLAKQLIEDGTITVGQLIDEYNYDWIHISLPSGHKNQIIHKKIR